MASAVILSFFPLLLGMVLQDERFIFSGFVLNPIDGYSYLAKMQIGIRGEWLFQLPYTAQEGGGAYLFLFYIFLGHLSRIFQSSPVVIFHLARFVAVVFFVYSTQRFLDSIHSPWLKSTSACLSALIFFGSGLGWLAGPLGLFTMDFWVAEAYPFLTMLANPHFPLGMGLLLVYFTNLQKYHKKISWFDPILGVGIAIVLPFGVIVGIAVTLFFIFCNWFFRKLFFWKYPVAVYAPAGLVLAYQYIATLSDPFLSNWNLQNQTPTPSLFIFFLSFSPLLLFALIGVVRVVLERRNSEYYLVMGWFLSGLLLAYFPFALQRRFLLGFLIPAGVMSIIGLGRIVRENFSKFSQFFWIIFPVSVLTNVFILWGAFQAMINRDPNLFLKAGEVQVLEWLDKNICKERPVVLAPPDISLKIPAFSACRVIYGHPFETANADEMLQYVESIYGEQRGTAFEIEGISVDYMIIPRESASLENWAIHSGKIIFQNSEYSVLKLQ